MRESISASAAMLSPFFLLLFINISRIPTEDTLERYFPIQFSRIPPFYTEYYHPRQAGSANFREAFNIKLKQKTQEVRIWKK
jgi:hypothetical protein